MNAWPRRRIPAERSSWALFALFAAALCLSMNGWAQGPAALALALARKVDTHYDHLRSLRVHFTQSYDGMGMHRVESGMLLLAKGGRFHAGRMRWTYDQPPGKLFVFDGKDAYFYTPGQTEVQRVPARELNDLRSPLSLLLGHADLSKQLFNLTDTPDANGDSTLSGVPRGLAGRVSRLSVTAAPSGVIHRLVIEDTDGSRNAFTFTGEQPDVPASAAAFHFTPPPGTHVVEGMPPM